MAPHGRSLDRILTPDQCPIGDEVGSSLGPCPAVVKIENAPYTITRQEVKQLFGRSTGLADNWPIHILMERSTGKTMDFCYVEFKTQKSAEEAVQRILGMCEGNQSPRIGNRPVEVTMSSAGELMAAIFPLAKSIKWEGGRPVQAPKRQDEQWSTGFNGFLTDEELFCTGRHAREPSRSIFSSKVPQRTYESIISTIWKFPWYESGLYTVHVRNKLFVTLKGMIVSLITQMQRKRVVGLDEVLLAELLRAGMQCPAFTPRMKYILAEVSENQEAVRRMHSQAAAYFPFDTLGWLHDINFETLSWYISLIALGRPLVLPRGLQTYDVSYGKSELFGGWWFGWDDESAKQITWAAAVNAEMAVLRQMVLSGYQVQTGQLMAQSPITQAASPSVTVAGTSTSTSYALTAPRSLHTRFWSEPSAQRPQAWSSMNRWTSGSSPSGE
ncbi:hypothetical protein N7539_004749 [Penicillium diatomitis]|uniref:RRM domain-containing protein n=1 Tax=Penicillium diatomitis TaxID=2819901 RepID=A0A9W9X639_9EURO|nr:uncharacterized protein N7539_004749 [Penicillium diatomitis]KAJ5484761.1 hypothetical protein N7539_004749 [Penicillium diatomitis]